MKIFLSCLLCQSVIEAGTGIGWMGTEISGSQRGLLGFKSSASVGSEEHIYFPSSATSLLSDNSQTSKYFILETGQSDEKEGLNTLRKTIVIVDYQSKRKLTGDDSNDDDDDDVNSEEDSDFDLEDDEGGEGMVTFEDQEDIDENEDVTVTSSGKLTFDSGGGGDSIDDSDDSDDNDSLDLDNDDTAVSENENEGDTDNAKSISQLKTLWREVIRSCQNKQLEAKADEIAQAVASHLEGNNSLPVGVTIDVSKAQPLSVILSLFPSLLRANGTNRASFHRQLEAQFTDPVAVGNRALWMDQEFALVLKGI
jgi:hypothetical protein